MTNEERHEGNNPTDKPADNPAGTDANCGAPPPKQRVYKKLRALTDEEWKKSMEYGKAAEDAEDERLRSAMSGGDKKKSE